MIKPGRSCVLQERENKLNSKTGHYISQTDESLELYSSTNDPSTAPHAPAPAALAAAAAVFSITLFLAAEEEARSLRYSPSRVAAYPR